MYPLLTNINSQFIDECGKPLAGGKVYTYEANTTTPKPTYADTEGLSVNTNPIILDEFGRAKIYLADGAYRIRVLNKKGALVADTAKISRYVTSTELDEFIQTVQDGVDDLNQVKEALDVIANTAIDSQKGMPGGLVPLNNDNKIDLSYITDDRVGTIMMWLSISIPENYLEIKGQTLTRSGYPALFDAYEIEGETFLLPDTRGEFVRGLDNGRGIDNDRTIGSAQGDMIKSHTHTYFKDNVGGGTASAGGSGNGQNAETGGTGGVETRPRNIAMIYIIKVK